MRFQGLVYIFAVSKEFPSSKHTYHMACLGMPMLVVYQPPQPKGLSTAWAQRRDCYLEKGLKIKQLERLSSVSLS